MGVLDVDVAGAAVLVRHCGDVLECRGLSIPNVKCHSSCCRLCLLRSLERENALPQPSTSQAYGRSPVCVRLWSARWLDFANALPQPSTSHAYGRSPVCLRLWTVSWFDCANALPQPFTSHAYRRSPGVPGAPPLAIQK